MNIFAPCCANAPSANSSPRRNNSGGFGSKSSSVGFHSTSTPAAFPSGVSSNSICMSMTCVIPACATFSMFSAVQIPPPTAIRSVNQVISIPFLRDLLTMRLLTCSFSPPGFVATGSLGFVLPPTQIATLSRFTPKPHSTVSLTPASPRGPCFSPLLRRVELTPLQPKHLLSSRCRCRLSPGRLLAQSRRHLRHSRKDRESPGSPEYSDDPTASLPGSPRSQSAHLLPEPADRYAP